MVPQEVLSIDPTQKRVQLSPTDAQLERVLMVGDGEGLEQKYIV